MVRGSAQLQRQMWKRPKDSMPADYRRERMTRWRREQVCTRIDKPTRLDAARRLGYKAKQGVVVVRTRVRRGGLRKGKIHMKRKPSKAGIRKITMAKSIQRIAEERVARKYPNLEVLNSYWVGEDGKHKFYEVILVDPSHPCIKVDPQLNFLGNSTAARPAPASVVVACATRARAPRSCARAWRHTSVAASDHRTISASGGCLRFVLSVGHSMPKVDSPRRARVTR